MKTSQIRGTAQLPSAHTEPADDLGLVADADLFKLDTDAEDARQVLDQPAEIHPAFRNEKENDLAAVERIFRLDHLHIEFTLIDLPQTIAHRVLGLDPVILNLLEVSLGRLTQNFSLDRLRFRPADGRG